MINNHTLPNYQRLWQQTTNWQPNHLQEQLFQQVYSEIINANQYLNLTRIIKPDQFWEKHLWDSLAPVLSLDLKNLKVIDIGTGAGFPGIPVAIIFPHSQVTLLDSIQKKINFLQDLINKLSLNNAKTLLGRVEAIAHNQNYREKYDCALIRAVAEVSVCVEYTLPLLKKGGISILYRGQFKEKEVKNLNYANQKLGGKIEKIDKLTTPLNQNIRHIITIKKINTTPTNFPRRVGQVTKKPLLVKDN